MITLKVRDYTVNERTELLSLLVTNLQEVKKHYCSQNGSNLCMNCEYWELCRDLHSTISYLVEYDSPT